MFAPIFCGQVVTGSWRGFPWRWLTIEGVLGGEGGLWFRRSGLVSVGRRLHRSPVPVPSSSVCPVERDVVWHLRIYVHGQPITHIGDDPSGVRGGGGRWSLGLGVRECGLCFSTPLPRPSCAGLCLVLCIPVYLRFLSSTLLSTPLLTTPFHFLFFLAAICGSSSKIQRITREKKTRNFAKILLT